MQAMIQASNYIKLLRFMAFFTPAVCLAAYVAKKGRTRILLPSFWKRNSSSVSIKSLEDLTIYIKEKNPSKVIVLAGAGISTASGIPDFRSPGTGLYDNIQKYNLPYPEAIFDIAYFEKHPEPFFQLSQELYPSGKYKPNEAHFLAKLLQEKKLLLRMYTQNIDSLERVAGVSEIRLIEAHGTYAHATCRMCRQKYPGEEIKDDILAGRVPFCRKKRCKGIIKPDIVFFGEQLPTRFYKYLVDMPKADLVIVMGTSLGVYPFAGIVDDALQGVPRVLFNRDVAGSFASSPRKNDVFIPGNISENIWKWMELLGWEEDLENLMNKKLS